MIPGSERSPGGGNGNSLTWRIPWTEEPGELPSMGVQRVGQDLAPNNDDNVEKFLKHWAKLKKPDMKGHRFYDSIFMKWPNYASL